MRKYHKTPESNIGAPARTASHKNRILESERKKKFVLRDTPADVVKSLSSNELVLWMNMRRLADGRTGALAFRGKPISAERIEQEAKMGARRRKETMRRLIAKGLVLMVREHTVREFAGRKRFVFQKVQYWVSETPRKDWVSSTGPCKNQPKMRVSSTGPFLNQFKKGPHKSYQNPPRGGAGKRPLLGETVHVHSENHQGSTTEDDSLPTLSVEPTVPDLPFKKRLGELKRQAEEQLMRVRSEENRPTVRTAIETVAIHAINSGVTPQSAKYFVTGVENLNDEEWEAARRLPAGSALAEAWVANNLMILEAERVVKESGKDFFEVFHEIRSEVMVR